MSISWTKSYSASDDGSILYGADLQNLQSDIDTATMHLADTQTVTGTKTFNTIPILPSSDPTTDNQASRKLYVDSILRTYYSTTSQSITAETRTYITGSKVTVPTGKLRIGTIFRWTFNITKTAAGVAASTFDIAVGTAGTTADTARVSFAKPAGTAVADEGFVTIMAIVRGPLSASGIMVGEFIMVHNLAATGHATIPCVVVNTVSAAFDVTVVNLYVGVCITSGAADAITIQQVTTEVNNL